MNPAKRPVARRSILLGMVASLVSFGAVQQAPALAQTPPAPAVPDAGHPVQHADHPPYHAIVGVL
ncbi:hypothetical protein [Sinomonas sp. ASV322]|uniref:hypothetical protein n=1 Tax=Sinomonas sp. ASV322 TaxID=3041920 RepID=UPI0027DC951E|nr:hypothetical protein [Sinomonas sp. ASV322]MDQ4502864.1 hypothetical protein [Sinomonas sp. ASV322]